VHLGTSLRSLALSVSDVELKLEARNAMLDAMMDLHNELNAWSLNTEHDLAAVEVTAILDRYLESARMAGCPTTPKN
jgi:hypothetical protein